MAGTSRRWRWALALVVLAGACRPLVITETAPAQRGSSDLFRRTAITYRSAAGTELTGTVFEPEEPWVGPGPRPIVGFAPGTQGLGRECTPSATLQAGTNYEQSTIVALLARGWAVAVTDYPHAVREAAGRALLDAVRAAQQLPDSDVTPESPVGLWGYGQGGRTAAAAAELAATVAPQLDVRGTVAGAVPADLARMADHLDGSHYVGYLAFLALGLAETFPGLALDEGVARLQADDAPCVFAAIGELRGTRLAPALETAAWQERLDEQRLGTTAPTAPVFLYHGNGDQVVAFDQGTALRDAWCALGAPVVFREYPVEHLAGIYVATTHGADFLVARFAATPVGTTCYNYSR